MTKVVHIRTAKVVSYESDMTPVIERPIIKIEVGRSFDNFLKHVNLQNYIKKDPPVIVKALEVSEGKTKEISAKEFQARLEAALNPTPKEETDYKKLSAELLKRLEALEAKESKAVIEEEEDLIGNSSTSYREDLEEEAESLGIVFPANIKDETLLKKIQALNPDFGV